MLIRPLALIGILLLVACRRPETSQQTEDRMVAESDSVRPMFDSVFASFGRRFTAGQVDSLYQRYATNAHIMPPNSAPIRGRDSLHAMYAAYFRSGPQGALNITVRRVIRNGPLAVMRAGWTFDPAPANPMPADTGESVTVWYRSGDDWRILEDIWHSDLPVRPAPPPARHR